MPCIYAVYEESRGQWRLVDLWYSFRGAERFQQEYPRPTRVHTFAVNATIPEVYPY